MKEINLNNGVYWQYAVRCRLCEEVIVFNSLLKSESDWSVFELVMTKWNEMCHCEGCGNHTKQELVGMSSRPEV